MCTPSVLLPTTQEPEVAKEASSLPRAEGGDVCVPLPIVTIQKSRMKETINLPQAERGHILCVPLLFYVGSVLLKTALVKVEKTVVKETNEQTYVYSCSPSAVVESSPAIAVSDCATLLHYL